MSAIAREFDCTPSAISYIVRKAEASGLTAEGAGPAPVADVVQPSLDVAPPTPQPAPAQPESATAAPDTVPAADAVEPEQREPRRLEHRGDGPRQPRPDMPPREAREPREPREQREPREPRQPQGEGRPPYQDRRGGERQGRFQQGQPRPQGERAEDRPQGGQRFERQGDSRRDRSADQRPAEPRFADQRGPRPERGPERGYERGLEIGPPPLSEAELNGPPADVVYPYRQQRNAARMEAQETPTVPADQRMEAAAKICAEAYLAWKAQSGEANILALSDALHEMRKVMARMEIEMSSTRKEEQRPIPIPGYRHNQPPPQQPRG